MDGDLRPGELANQRKERTGRGEKIEIVSPSTKF